MSALLLYFFVIINRARADDACERELEIARISDVITATARDLNPGGSAPVSPVAWRARTGPAGLPALDLPADFGGADWPAVDLARVFSHAGRIALDLRDVIGAGHARLLARVPAPAVREVVRAVARGEAYLGIAITEADAGSDLHAMTSVATAVPGGFELTGAKLYNARLASATHVIVFTRSAARPGRLDAFVIPRDHPGLRIESLDAHGLHGNSFGGLTFERMFVPTELAVTADGGGGAAFRDHFAYWRLMMAAAAIGTGEGALDQVVERLRHRRAFGGPIGRFTHLQQPLAEHTAKLRMANLLVREAARALDRGDATAAVPLVAMAKAEGVEFALAAADFAMKTFGAEGYSTRVDLGQRVIDLMGLRIADGTTDVLRAEVVRQTYGRDLWEMAVGPPPGAGAPPAMMVGAPAPAPPRAPAWAKQEDYDPLIRPGGGGACATVTAFNFTQSLRNERGLDDLNPRAVIAEAWLEQPDLLDGRVSNAQFEDLLRTLARTHLPSLDLNIKITDGAGVASKLEPDSRRLLAYLVFAKDGRFVGRHFVVVTEVSPGRITVQDPRDPHREFTYDVVHGADGRTHLRFEQTGREYPVDAVFNVRVGRPR